MRALRYNRVADESGRFTRRTNLVRGLELKVKEFNIVLIWHFKIFFLLCIKLTRHDFEIEVYFSDQS